MYYYSPFCRLCVNTDKNLVNIFCVENDILTFSDKMKLLCPEIDYEDNIPNYICKECCKLVSKMYEFKKKCLKNNEILKFYTSKLLNVKENPENINLETELQLLQKQISQENSDINLNLIYIENKQLISPELTKKDRNSHETKDQLSEDEEIEKDEGQINNKSKNENFNIFEPELKLECHEDDDDSYLDQLEDAGDESMDCDEIVSVNDSENDNGEEDTILSEPMNLTSKSLQNHIFEGNSVLPPHLASGNRGKTRTNDKYRMVYTEHQRLELEKEYLLNRFIPDRRRAELAISLCLTVRQIKIWFQNRRAKERRETKRSDTSPQENITPKPKPDAVTPKPKMEKKELLVLKPEEIVRKQQEYYLQQQILHRQRDILVQEQLLRQRKQFVQPQQFYSQQEIIRQEEYIKQQKKFFDQQQQLLRQHNILPENLLQQQASLLINQPMLINQLMQNQVGNISNAPIFKDSDKELLPNLEELYKRKLELMKRNEKNT